MHAKRTADEMQLNVEEAGAGLGLDGTEHAAAMVMNADGGSGGEVTIQGDGGAPVDDAVHAASPKRARVAASV